ncbi:His-Xaa-Ser system protein HxsD [Pseudomonas sp. DWP3-1-2]|uniref:His-Xaa-Ser system protein HxsD n=1 Tax=Pseudomonas sp. DWP3-1-2 TaxID=2804645 RepID=UPI003CEA65D0
MNWDVTVSVDCAIYPLSVVQRTAYALAPKISIQISQTLNMLHLHAVPALLAGGPQDVPSEDEGRELILRNLNDFAMRALIQQETSGLRQVLANAALHGAGV